MFEPILCSVCKTRQAIYRSPLYGIEVCHMCLRETQLELTRLMGRHLSMQCWIPGITTSLSSLAWCLETIITTVNSTWNPMSRPALPIGVNSMYLPDSHMDIRRHPLDATSLVNWMLAAWEIHPEQTLLILTMDGDGDALDNRIRVRLTKARKSVIRTGAKLDRFGFHSTCIKWTELTGDTCEALFLHRVVTRKQVFGMVIDDMEGEM